MTSLTEIQKMFGFPKTENKIFLDDQEASEIISIITCLKNYPVISAENARIITKYSSIIKQVIFCLKKVSEVSYQGKNEVTLYYNDISPIAKLILMCLGLQVSTISIKRIAIKWWYN